MVCTFKFSGLFCRQRASVEARLHVGEPVQRSGEEGRPIEHASHGIFEICRAQNVPGSFNDVTQRLTFSQFNKVMIKLFLV